jgi:hypothetical protein
MAKGSNRKEKRPMAIGVICLCLNFIPLIDAASENFHEIV